MLYPEYCSSRIVEHFFRPKPCCEFNHLITSFKSPFLIFSNECQFPGSCNYLALFKASDSCLFSMVELVAIKVTLLDIKTNGVGNCVIHRVLYQKFLVNIRN